jgi:hypothetical protein
MTLEYTINMVGLDRTVMFAGSNLVANHPHQSFYSTPARLQ